MEKYSKNKKLNGVLNDIREQLLSIHDTEEESRKEVWCGDVSAEEFEGEDSRLDNVTLYDYPLYGPSSGLLAFCSANGVDLQGEWSKQYEFDKVARDAMMEVW